MHQDTPITSRDGSEGADEGRDRFRSLVDDIGAILWEAELPSLRFTFVSHRAEDILGYPVSRWHEEPGFWVSCLHPEDRERAIEHCRWCTERGEDHEFEYRAIAADGSVVWLRDIVHIVDEEGEPRRLRGVMVDITASKRAAEELEVRSCQLAAVTGAMTSFLRTGDWSEASAGLLRNALKQTGSEYGFIGVVVEDTLRVLAHEGIRWDNTLGRKLYTEALRLYDERGYLEFTNLDNLFGRVVTERRAVISNDPSTDERSGGRPPGHPPLRAFLGVPIFSGEGVVGMVGIANRPGGYTGTEQDKLEIVCRAIGVLYEDYVRGIREAQLKSERRRLEERLRQSQKMEALGQLAGGIAHDFNNLLTAILGNAELAGQWLDSDDPERDDERTREAIEEIRRAGERAAGLTRQLLVFGRRHVLKVEVLDPNIVVGNLAQMLQRLIGGHIRVVVELGSGVAPIRADPTQLEQVILNLVLNARDAMPDGGTLEIRTGEGTFPELGVEGGAEAVGRAEGAGSAEGVGSAEGAGSAEGLRGARGAADVGGAGRASGGGAAEGTEGAWGVGGAGEPGGAGTGRCVVLTVRDNGRGMDGPTRERIFEPFFTTKPVGQGTGLGLATVYGIVSQAGGRILVDSEPGKGSTFSVLLPVAEASLDGDGGPGEPAATEGEEPIGGELGSAGAEESSTVLVCEDEAPVRRLMCSILRDCGYRVLEAADPRAALRMVEEHSGRVDLLVTDVVMPEINGKVLADRLLRDHSGLKVLFVSGYTPEHIARDIPGGGLEPLLPKPFSAIELVDRVQRVLGGVASG